MAANTASRRRILIVDDDRALRFVLSNLLERRRSYRRSGPDGREALRRLDAGAFDIVLLDIGLPDLSGLDVLAHARTVASPPIVVMMTADDTPETLLSAVRQQAYRYLRKPFAPTAIVEVIDDAIASAPSASLSIEVVSARPEWVELVAPCVLEMADRIQSFVMQLETESAGARARIGRTGLSRDADERHRVGRQARSPTEGPDFVCARQASVDLPHR